MLCVPAYPHECRPYSATLYQTSFTLDSLRPSRFAPSARLMGGCTPFALCLPGDSSCGCMFWDERGGGLTGQSLGPLVGTAAMTAVMSANRVDLGSFSSRCCTFQRKHTSVDPIRLLYIRLALPFTLSLPSQFVAYERLTVGVPPRALWLAGIFLRRKKICAGVVGTRTEWVLKGEGGEMTTPLLQYVARFDSGGEISGFEWGGYKENRQWCSLFVRIPSLFVAPSGEQLALLMCWRRTSLSTISRVFVPLVFSGRIIVVDVKRVGFRSRAVKVRREVMSGCTRISSQE